MPELVSPRERLATVRQLLEKSKPQIQMALPRHLTAERMLRIVMTSIQRTPKLLECDPVSLVGATIEAAQLGLEPDGVLGHAYLIPFWNGRAKRLESVFMPGYKGLLALARRSGEIGPVEARVVYERDHFKYAFGLSPVLEHVPAAGDRGNPTHVYAIVRLKDGTVMFDVMTAAEVEQHRQRYSRATGDDTPWATAWPQMAMKTVLKRVLKFAPASVELQRAIALDEHVEAGIPQELTAVATLGVEAAAPPSRSALDALADRLATESAEKGGDTDRADSAQVAGPAPTAAAADASPAGTDQGTATPSEASPPSPSAQDTSELAAAMSRQEVLEQIDRLAASRRLRAKQLAWFAEHVCGTADWRAAETEVLVKFLEALRRMM
ncbi:MAG TPA: recombinase RecT [Gaiellaceae bacterium]|nr:recombinase RecT [Gaiellaceae bacterium]